MSVEERFDMERQYHDHESTHARLSGRRKFQLCRQCESVDGMQACHRDTLANLLRGELERLAPILHSMNSDSTSLFYACYCCNPDRILPSGYRPMTMDEVLDWLDRDPMAPDYEALAAEEPVSQIEDSRESAGMEG